MSEGSSIRIPADLVEEIKPIAASMSRAGVDVPWNKVAIAGLRRGIAQIKKELNNPPENGPIAA